MKNLLFIILFFVVVLGTCAYIDSRQDPYQEGIHFDYTIVCEGGFKYKMMGNNRGTILLLNSDGTPLRCDKKRY